MKAQFIEPIALTTTCKIARNVFHSRAIFPPLLGNNSQRTGLIITADPGELAKQTLINPRHGMCRLIPALRIGKNTERG